MLKFDGFDKALMGKADIWAPTRAGMALVTVAIYDGERMVKVLVRKKMAEQEAREFISFAIEGKPMGPQTPIIYWPEQELKLINRKEH